MVKARQGMIEGMFVDLYKTIKPFVWDSHFSHSGKFIVNINSRRFRRLPPAINKQPI